MVTARGSLTCGLTERERATLRAAQERAAQIYEHGITAEEYARIEQELAQRPKARQASLPLRHQR